LSNKTFKGAALPSPKRLRAGRCKGFSAHPTAFWNVFYATGGFRDREVGRSKGGVKERSILEILYILKL
jgi:hypothetical protein